MDLEGEILLIKILGMNNAKRQTIIVVAFNTITIHQLNEIGTLFK